MRNPLRSLGAGAPAWTAALTACVTLLGFASAGFTCTTPGGGPPPCADQCMPGFGRCNGGLVETCADFNMDGCVEFGASLPCTAGSCTFGVCGDPASCQDECTNLNVAQCSGNTVQICGEFDGDDCLDLGPATACGGGDSCTVGLCTPSCSDECAGPGVVTCVSTTGQRICGQWDTDTCLDLSAPIPCPAGQYCGMAVTGLMACQTCTDDCDPSTYADTCGGTSFTECVADGDADPCFEVVTADCSSCNGRPSTDQCRECCPMCGDGACTGTEGACTCPGDCPSVCGDGCCNGAENTNTCCLDCVCPQFFYCPGVGGCIYSCPFVYSADATGGLVYETEVAGTSLIGSVRHLADGRDREFAELWARLDHAAVERAGPDGQGSLRAKILEGVDEITYLDEVHLTVVEHPPGYEVVSTSAVYWPMLKKKDPQEFWALRTAALRAPLAARWLDPRGTPIDVTGAISTLDDREVASDVRADNVYELDFGAVKDARRARLVVDGWKFKETRDLPPDVERRGPRLEVVGADGAWHEALPLALPRGDRKAVAFDLSAVSWPEGRYHFRFWTGTDTDGMAMWHIDRVRLTEEPAAPVRTFDLPAAAADLAFSGAPTFVDPGNKSHPLWNADDGKGPLPPEFRTWGRFTRYGDVRALLTASDDLFVVMRMGDGVALRFDGIPPAAPGTAQSFFLASDLVYKPRVCPGCPGPTPESENVEPLPFHAMGHYPPRPDTAYPTDAAHARYVATWNTREYLPGDPRWGK